MYYLGNEYFCGNLLGGCGFNFEEQMGITFVIVKCYGVNLFEYIIVK